MRVTWAAMYSFRTLYVIETAGGLPRKVANGLLIICARLMSLMHQSAKLRA